VCKEAWDTWVDRGSPRRVIAFGPTLKVSWGIAKSAKTGPRV